MNKKKIIQKLMGVACLVISVLLIRMASMGATVEEQDATAVLITIPLGLWLIFSKEVLIY